MKTTLQIKQKLIETKIEVKRISELLDNDQSLENTKYFFKNGIDHQGEWTFKDALTSYVSKQLTLEWVLGIN